MIRRSLLPMLISLLVLACTDATGPSRGLVGTWRLQTVNGLPLPFTLSEGPADKLELTGEALTLVAAGTFTMVTTFRVTQGGNVFPESVPDQGSYTVNGSTVTFTFESDGSTITMTVSGNTMTDADVDTFVYRRD
ncbi:MAG TPA: lipocalin family protein [Gemmatimonadales bacterium]